MKQKLQNLQNKEGPFVIIGRPHSGTRLLASIFAENGIFMGSGVAAGYLDSLSWHRLFVYPLVTSKFFPDWKHPECKQFAKKQLKNTITEFFSTYKGEQYWGWKYSETLFVMPLLQQYFPQIKFIHVIRDGRDVALSDDGYFQLTKRSKPTYNLARLYWRLKNLLIGDKLWDFHMKVAFGDSSITQWNGFSLSKNEMMKNRFAIQMQSWMNCVRTAKQYGKEMPRNYMEVRYEDLCADPEDHLQNLFSKLGVPLKNETIDFAKKESSTTRIGKWKRYPFTAEDKVGFDTAVEHGSVLLKELGYR